MDFGSMVKIAMLLLSRRDEVGKALDLIREITNTIGGAKPSSAPPAQSGGYPVGSMSWLQESLNKLNNAGLEVDGDYGAATNKAVAVYQKARGLNVDGWAGPETVALIMKELG
jgi:peptidoglycan hydrolase-like protein with peptidoglycan-binding domain